MALNEETINSNRDRFLELVNSIEREGVQKDKLIAKLTTSDFFVAPASSVYHMACKGGLTQHCLNVYDNLVKLTQMKFGDECPYTEDTLKIVALFHDFSKMNYYEADVKNKKVYSSIGKKKDEVGNFDWISVPGYKTKDASTRFCFGNHEMNALYMTQSFIPLSVEEASAILHHMGSMSFDSAKDDISVIFGKYPLALLLYEADMISTYIDEKE